VRLRAVLFDLHGVISDGGPADRHGRFAEREGCGDLVRGLARAGVTMAVGTSDRAGAALAILEDLGLRLFFAGAVGAEEVKRLKPSPEVYQKALALTGARLDEAVVIDDTPHGVEAGRAAGLVVVAAPQPGEWPAWRLRGAAHLRVDSLRELDVRVLNALLHRVRGAADGREPS